MKDPDHDFESSREYSEAPSIDQEDVLDPSVTPEYNFDSGSVTPDLETPGLEVEQPLETFELQGGSAMPGSSGSRGGSSSSNSNYVPPNSADILDTQRNGMIGLVDEVLEGEECFDYVINRNDGWARIERPDGKLIISEEEEGLKFSYTGSDYDKLPLNDKTYLPLRESSISRKEDEDPLTTNEEARYVDSDKTFMAYKIRDIGDTNLKISFTLDSDDEVKQLVDDFAVYSTFIQD